MPTIAIDYTPAYEQGGGIGRYVRELIAALGNIDAPDNHYRLFVAGAGRKPFPKIPGTQFEWKPTALTPAWLARLWGRARLPFPVEFFTGDVDLYHATDFVLPPTRKKTRTVLTVHDLSFLRVPETASPGLRRYLEDVVPRSVQRANYVLADSEATKHDLIRYYQTAAEKIEVLYSGVDSRFRPITDTLEINRVRQQYNILDRPYILSVGTVQPRKNYPTLIEAVSRLNHPEICVVIVGGKGWLDDPIFEAIHKLRMQDRVIFAGFVADDDLPALYSGSLCMALPSLYEGFGLPVLEAMACGVPVITSNLSSLPEVAGEAGILVTPTSLDEITNALERIITDTALRETMITRGLHQAQKFSWETGAQQLLRVYTRLLS